MGLVCLIRDGPHERYFVNRLQEVHGVELIVAERRPSRTEAARRAYDGAGVAGLADAVRYRARRLRTSRARRAARGRWLSEGWRTLPPGVPCLGVDSVNDDEVLRRPELADAELLTCGASIVKPPLLRRAALALNLHWGLAPYYRGLHCVAWALVGWDPYNVGVTVHRLSREIDGGPIVGQARAALEAHDTLDSIRLQLTSLGTEIMIEAVRRVRAGEELPLTPQDLSLGRVTYRRQWSPELRRHVERMERDGALERMLRAPARAERLPIVTLPTERDEVAAADHRRFRV